MSHADDASDGGALRDGTRLVVRAGQPTADEIAALIAAVDTARDGSAQGGEQRRAGRPSAWQRAARLEAAGAGRLATPADLERESRPQPGWP